MFKPFSYRVFLLFFLSITNVSLNTEGAAGGEDEAFEFHRDHPAEYRASLFRVPQAELIDKIELRAIAIPETSGKLIKTQSKRKMQSWKRLVATIEGESDPEEEATLELSGALVLFPVGRESDSTIVFSFGNAWRRLPRRHFRESGFGRKILSAEAAGTEPDPQASGRRGRGIKRIRKRTRSDPNPLETNAKRARIASLASFGIHPIEEEIEQASATTGLSRRLAEGGDDFVFRASNTASERHEDLKTLETLALKLYKLSTSHMVRVGMEFFRDDTEVRDPEGEAIPELNKILLEKIREIGHPFVFSEGGEDWNLDDVEKYTLVVDATAPAASASREEGDEEEDLISLIGRERTRHSEDQALRKNVRVKLYEEEEFRHAPVLDLLSTSPIFYNGGYYYLKRGTWYYISRETTEKRRNLVSETLLIEDLIDFPKFNPRTDTERKADKTVASENAYNRRVVKDFKEDKEIYLLDCKDVFLNDPRSGSRKSKFEFADIILKEGAKIYLFHVKRGFNGAGVSHLFHQARASARFLTQDPHQVTRSVKNIILEDAILPVLISPLREHIDSTPGVDRKNPKTQEELEQEINQLRRPRAIKTRSGRLQKKDEANDKRRAELVASLEEVKRKLEEKSVMLNSVFGEDVLSSIQLNNIHIVLAFIDESGRGFDQMPLSNVDEVLEIEREVENKGFRFDTAIINSEKSKGK